MIQSVVCVLAGILWKLPGKWDSSELLTDNTTQSKFYGVYEKERPTNYTPIFSEHDDPTPSTVGDIKYLLEIANIRKK